MHEGHRLGNGFVHVLLRQGQVHTAQGVLRFLQETLRLAEPLGYVVDLRIDAGYVHGEVLDWLTDQKAAFSRANQDESGARRLAAPHLARPVGRPPKEGYETIVELSQYQAESWKHPQRLVLVVVDRPDPKTGQLNLLPNYFFLIVGWKPEELSAEQALAHYSPAGHVRGSTGRVSAGDRSAPVARRLSRERDRAAAGPVGVQFGFSLRIEYEDAAGSCFDLARFQRDVLKAGGRVVKHARRLIVCVAQVVRPFWEHLVACLRRWRLPSRFPRRADRTGAIGCRRPGTPSPARCGGCAPPHHRAAHLAVRQSLVGERGHYARPGQLCAPLLSPPPPTLNRAGE